MVLSCLFDRELVVRCPYCTAAMGGFLQMVGHLDGGFICNRCGHTARPGDPDYVCLAAGASPQGHFLTARLLAISAPPKLSLSAYIPA
jgi:hypothetical protein